MFEFEQVLPRSRYLKTIREQYWMKIKEDNKEESVKTAISPCFVNIVGICLKYMSKSV